MDTPGKCISVTEARRRQDEWLRTRGKEIERAQGFQDTREFWYDLEELQEYLDYVREKSLEQGVVRPGIRIYLGAFPHSSEKRGYATIFLAPTKKVMLQGAQAETEDENNYSIEPLNDSQSGWPPKSY